MRSCGRKCLRSRRQGVIPDGVHRRRLAARAPDRPAITTDTVLYSQLDNDTGSAWVSQDFETALDQFDSEGADDFVVPPDVSWEINSVTANGQYFNGPEPAAAVNLTIFEDAAGLPGDPACSYPLQTPTDSSGSFVFTLPSPCVLQSGTYWIDVQVRMDDSAGGEWGFEGRSVVSNSGAVWRNPGNGFATGCTNFASVATCISGGPDFMFSLSGAVVVVTPKPFSWIRRAPAA